MVLDVMMPGMSGYEVCKAVRSNKRLTKVPVVFLTAKGTPQDYKSGHDAGGVIYMVKPFRPERLLQVVRLFCRVEE
jgi:putative two-component system response regulator